MRTAATAQTIRRAAPYATIPTKEVPESVIVAGVDSNLLITRTYPPHPCRFKKTQSAAVTLSCPHLATPFSKPPGYHIPVPKQSGHCEASTLFAPPAPPASEFPSSSSCRISFFQSRRRRCSVRNAGTLETL